MEVMIEETLRVSTPLPALEYYHLTYTLATPCDTLCAIMLNSHELFA